MSQPQFHIELNQTREQHYTAAKRRLDAILAEYYLTTENFDRRLPGGWSHRDPDTWMPHERGLSTRFAREEWQRAMALASSSGYLSAEIDEAKLRMSELRYGQWKQIVLDGGQKQNADHPRR